MPFAALIVACAVASAAFLFSGDPASGAAPPTSAVRVVRSVPHDTESFCQGLVFHNSNLWEGTGQYSRSRLRQLNLQNGQPVRDLKLDDEVFGEGITVWKNQILQLTWKNGYLIVYEVDTLKRLGTVAYRDVDPSWREGWGITHDGRHLIVSDGSPKLRFIDPESFRLVRTIIVKNGWRSLNQLNELEFVDGEIFANVWYRDEIARINPDSGAVIGWLDLGPVKPREVRFNREAVLNGIAWDSDNRRLFVTGKNWPKLFEIQIVTDKSR